MSRFRDEREHARKRCAYLERVVADAIGDPDLRIHAVRAAQLQRTCTVTLRIALTCEFHVTDEASGEAICVLAPLAYKKLAVYARTHFFDHIGTDPNQKASV